MEWVGNFLIQNFILLCVSTIVIVNSVQHYKENKKVSIYSCIIIGLTLLLAVAGTIENYGKAIVSVDITTAFSFFGYVIRPVIVYLFVLMCYKGEKKKWFYLTIIPLIFNFIVFIFCFVPGAKYHVVYYVLKSDNTLAYSGGNLRFTSHGVSAVYLVWLFYIAFSQIRKKHIRSGVGLILCGLFVIASVVIETFLNDDGNVYLLNATIGVSTLTYYVFTIMERSKIDALTGLYSRASYYQDHPRMEKSLTGVIQFDLNGLKYINDNFGHLEGDKALGTISNIILNNVKSRMYAYRLGGDEFMILINDTKEEAIIEMINNIKDELSKTEYYCSIGFAYRKDANTSIESITKEAEQKMYQDKEEFYKNSNIERRRGLKA